VDKFVYQREIEVQQEGSMKKQGALVAALGIA